jgi:lipopolysaccharide biosynthesis glycosyltransferase
MIGEGVSSVYIGCATDSKFVDLTCTMLSSLDDNGRIPEATILVADFGLSATERDQIATCAGRANGRQVCFIEYDSSSAEIVALPSYQFPLPLLGRFLLPNHIHEPKARLIVMDSDMVVNRSMRQLFETNMRGYILAAVNDPVSWREHYGREPANHYFNAGLMMIDVDRFRAESIGPRVMQKLASFEERPMWLDQDAINELLGKEWLTLDRRWNFFHSSDYRAFTTEDYRSCDILHFAGPKPSEQPEHPGAPIYHEHVARVHQKLRHQPDAGGIGNNRVFMAMCYEILLGRQRENDAVLKSRAHFTATEFIGSIIESEEFRSAVVEPLKTGMGLPLGRFSGKPSVGQRYWAADRLPMLVHSARRVELAENWVNLLSPLLEDPHFMQQGKMAPLTLSIPDSVHSH